MAALERFYCFFSYYQNCLCHDQRSQQGNTAIQDLDIVRKGCINQIRPTHLVLKFTICIHSKARISFMITNSVDPDQSPHQWCGSWSGTTLFCLNAPFRMGWPIHFWQYFFLFLHKILWSIHLWIMVLKKKIPTSGQLIS